MSNFNFDAFRPVAVDTTAIDAKHDRIATASKEKQNRLAARTKAQDDSWAGGLGLEGGSFASNRINDVASLVSGGSRLIGDVVSLVPNAGAAIETLGASDDDYAAFTRVQRGSTNPNDLKRAQQFQHAETLRGMAKKVKQTFDLSGIVDQTNRQELSADLGDDFEANWSKVTAGWEGGKPSQVVSGIAGLLMNAGEAVVTNPSAAREYIIENAPQLFTGALGAVGKGAMVASNLGYAADNYRQGLENYAAKNGGALPPEAERTRMALYAASLAAAEQAGDMIGLGAAKLGSKAASEAAATGLGQAVKNTAKAATYAGLSEAATEGYQTFAEGQVTGKPATAQEIYEGAVIGAVAGAGLSGGAHGLAESMQATPAHAQERAVEQTNKAKFDAAIAENKPEVFLDEASPNYNPTQAVKVINEVTKNPEVTPEEAKENVKKSGEIISKLESAKEQNTKTEANRNPAYIAQLETEIAQVQEALKTANPEAKAELTEEMDILSDELADLTDKQRILQRQNRMTSLERKLEEAREVHHGLVRMTNPEVTSEDVSSHIKAADSSDVEVSTKAGQVLLNLSMAAPDDLDPTVAQNLADNTQNGLSTDQRTQLRQFSEARLAENALKTMSEVSQEVLFGQKKEMGNVGIAQYRTRIAAAVASQNPESAVRQLTMLGDFAASHAAKLKAMEQAPKGAQIIKVNGQWEINTGKRLSDKEVKQKEGLTLNSDKLIGYVRAEAKALAAAHTQLSTAVATYFGQAVVQSIPSPVATSVPPTKLTEKSVKGETRLNDKPVQTVVEEPQKENKTEAKKQLSKEERQEIVRRIRQKASPSTTTQPQSTPTASPQSQPASPIAADAAQATAAQSATAEQQPTNNTTPEATKQPAAVSEANPAPVADVATAEDINPMKDYGTLSAMASKVDSTDRTMNDLFMDKVFNPVAHFLKQKRTSEFYKSIRPLVFTKDFLTEWRSGQVVPAEFHGLEEDEGMQKALRHFATQARKWNPILASNIGEGKSDLAFRIEDMMQYMVNLENGKINVDENLLTSMSFGMYHQMVAEASNVLTIEKLNKMHGRDEDADINIKAFTVLDGVANIEDTFVNELGTTALKALGLTASKSAPKDILPRLQTALGTHMMIAMETAGLIERQNINTKQVNELFAPIEGQTFKTDANTTYVFPNKEALAAYKEINKNTRNVVDRMFGAEPASSIAKTEPTKFSQVFAQHTQQRVPQALKKTLNELQNTPHTVIPEMWAIMGALGRDNVLLVAGARDLTKNIHIENLKGAEAKNNGLIKQLDLALEMLETDLGNPDLDISREFYVTAEVWKNFRVGITTDSLNQQSSKIHRYMFARPSWNVTIDLKKADERLALEVAIAAGLGIKTDEQSNEETAELLLSMYNNDAKLRAATDAVHNGLTSGVWENTDAIAEYAAGAEGMQTLQTLVAYSKMLNAPADGVLTNMTMLVGADGKTNGPMLTHLALGAAYDAETLQETMDRGGMYAVGDDQPKHFSQWRKENKGKDLYQDLSAALLRTIRGNAVDPSKLGAMRKAFYSNELNKGKSFPYFNSQLLAPIMAITGKLEEDGNVTKAGRDLVKTPLTAFAFGSSLAGSIRAMENKFIESIYTKIEKLSVKDESTEGLVSALNTLVSAQDESLGNMEAVAASELLNYKLTPEVEQALRKSFRDAMGSSVRQTMESYFATFIQRRTDLNSTIQAGFAMYEAAYSAARAQVLQGLMESGEIASRKQRSGSEEGKLIPLHDLSEEQENALRAKLTNILPVMHTAYSVGGNLNEGIYMAKSENQLSNNKLTTSIVNFANRVQTGDGTMRHKLEIKGMERVETDPGVAGTPYAIHSLDSANMHEATGKVIHSVNVHDEILNSILAIARAAGAINRATFQKMLNFSPAREALHMVERISIAVAEGVKDGSVSKETVASVMRDWESIIRRRDQMEDDETITPGEVVRKMMENSINNAVDADRVRLSILSQMGIVDQYTWEGGQYEVTPADRARAAKMLTEIETEIKPEAKLAMSQLVAYVKDMELPTTLKPVELDPVPQLNVTGADAATVVEAVGENVEQVTRTMASLSGTGLTVFGEIGPVGIAVNPAIKEAFQEKPRMSARDAMKMVMKITTGSDRIIANKLAQILPADLEVVLITPDTQLEDVIAPPNGEANGWYVEDASGRKAVYVKSPDFRHHGMNTQVLLHELVHAAVSAEVYNPTSKASQSIIKDLDDLMAYVKNSPGADKFAAALENNQEFIAYGMTNPEFQEFLKSIVYPMSRTSRNRLVNAMKEFTQYLTKMLFGETNDTKERALSILIANVGGLMEQSRLGRVDNMKLMLMHAAPASNYSTADIYAALGQNANNPLSPQDDTRLRGLMASMVEVLTPIYGAFGKDAMTNQSLSASSIWANAQAGGTAPFALDAAANGMAGNEQVAFMLEQVEVTMRASLSGVDSVSSVAYRELEKLYAEAQEALKGKLTQAEYDFVFAMEAGADDKSNYLSRFAALGLVHPKVNAALQFGTSRKADDDVADSLLGRLYQAFEKAMEWVTGRWTRTHAGQQADSKLDALATQLVMIEAKRRARLNVEQSKTMESIEGVFRNAAEGVRDKVDTWANGSFFKDSKNNFVKLAGTMTSTIVKDRLDQLMLAYEDFSNQHYHHSQGMFAGIVNEVRGSNALNVTFYKLLRMSKFLEGKRKDIITGTSKVALNSFVNNGKDLSDAHKKAISNVFMRTDMAALLERYEMKDLRELVADRAALSRAIVDVTAELGKPRHLMFYINASKALGYQMATGEARTANNLMNAHNIARLYGTKRTAEVKDNIIAQTEPLIDVLASLYALHYTDADSLADAKTIFDAEQARNDGGNGIEMVLKLHKQLQVESKERLFKEQESLMMKGYTPEIYNPYIEVQVVQGADVADMRELGFGKGLKLETAAADPEQGGRVLMARHGTGLQQYTTGTMSLTSMSSKGTAKHDGQMDLFSDKGQYNATMMVRINKRNATAVEAMFAAPIEPSNVEDTFMVPIVNAYGEVVNYRYMMHNATKDSVLDRDNRFEKLLGTMAGSIFDKQSTPKQNRLVIEALAAQYKLEGVERPKSFIEVGPRSPDPEMREIYRLLPESTKQAIREVWKSDTMRVRIDLLDINFGYRKLSMSDVLKKDRDARTGMDKFMGEFLSFAFTGKMLSPYADAKDAKVRDAKATVRIRQFEEIWQTLVHEAKDILVVKSVSTLVGNVMSNFTLLYGYGVPLTDVMRHHRIAFRGAVAYKRDSDELFALQTKLDTGLAGNKDQTEGAKKRVVQLKDSLAKNPVRELIEAGLMPTIVEDIELDDDIYSSKSKFITRMTKLTDGINPEVKSVAKQLYMAHDTKAYKTLSQAAQLSDFLGRYTLYQHMTTKKHAPMSKEDAIQLASDAFVNYDVPTHRKMQYLNDMGIFRFTKYYLRIQKVITHLYKENPGRMIALMGMNQYFDGMASVLDSSMVNRWGNPIDNGAFGYPYAIDDLATFKVLASPFKGGGNPME